MAESSTEPVGLWLGLQAGAFLGLYFGFSLALVSALTNPDELMRIVYLITAFPLAGGKLCLTALWDENLLADCHVVSKPLLGRGSAVEKMRAKGICSHIETELQVENRCRKTSIVIFPKQILLPSRARVTHRALQVVTCALEMLFDVQWSSRIGFAERILMHRWPASCAAHLCIPMFLLIHFCVPQGRGCL